MASRVRLPCNTSTKPADSTTPKPMVVAKIREEIRSRHALVYRMVWSPVRPLLRQPTTVMAPTQNTSDEVTKPSAMVPLP